MLLATSERIGIRKEMLFVCGKVSAKNIIIRISLDSSVWTF